MYVCLIMFNPALWLNKEDSEDSGLWLGLWLWLGLGLSGDPRFYQYIVSCRAAQNESEHLDWQDAEGETTGSRDIIIQ